MGQGGHIVLVNGTPYDWQRTGAHTYQMNAWGFYDRAYDSIPAGTSVDAYVEWDQFIFTRERDDAGEAEYTLTGTDCKFEIQARSGDAFNIQVYLKSITTQNNAQGSIIPLGWNHNGCVYFILSGTPGNFVSNNPPVDWLHSNLGTLGDRTLRHICIPGTHNSGMSVRTGETLFGVEDITLCQSLSVGDQLVAGARWFDIRPVKSGGVFKTGHYSYIDQINSWQGANGQFLQEIINQVNAFTADHSELVFLNLSHTADTDAGNSHYFSFTLDQWSSLLKELLGIQHLFVAPNSGTVNLNTLTLNSFIGQGKAAVVVLLDSGDNVDLTPLLSTGDYANKGFYKASQLTLFGGSMETNSEDVLEKLKAQLSYMKQEVKPESDRLFSLGWTLTQDAGDVANCLALTADRSIKSLAAGIYPELYRQLINYCSKQVYPNIIHLDYMSPNRDIVALAMAVNGFAA